MPQKRTRKRTLKKTERRGRELAFYAGRRSAKIV
jgi:hypothetical protein